MFPAHRVAVFVCDCRNYEHACQSEAAWDPSAFFRTRRRLLQADLNVFHEVLMRRGWRVGVLYDCVAKDPEARRNWLLMALRRSE